MSLETTGTPLIVETGRGPCIAGRRTTIYVILDHLTSGCDREFIKEHLLLSDQQFDAAVEYIQLHREEVERDYTYILQRAEERRQHYDKVYRKRASYDVNLSMKERIARMRRDIAEKKEALPSANDHQNLA